MVDTFAQVKQMYFYLLKIVELFYLKEIVLYRFTLSNFPKIENVNNYIVLCQKVAKI